MPLKCPLCQFHETTPFFTEKSGRRYFKCETCDLRFLDPRFYLQPEQEKARYKLHENSRDNAGFVQFHTRFKDWLMPRLTVGSRGLDYGCGPVPLLSEILTQAGFQMNSYDPFFMPDKDVLNADYDFIILAEVIEHMHNPAVELKRLRERLTQHGRLAIMTHLFSEAIAFAEWSYRRDPTHVAFYSARTIKWLQESLRFSSLEIADPRWILLTV